MGEYNCTDVNLIRVNIFDIAQHYNRVRSPTRQEYNKDDEDGFKKLQVTDFLGVISGAGFVSPCLDLNKRERERI